ncbi:WD repeat containing protein [Parasponia andersonii]|uniref:WD repeat containing protein n=1 Tax=Parasponia andersonii TaxID=3476 RepID=A0A2P5BXN5_PARAD|nr:WD repeat containing protein [Parasponia andersonii]
MQDTLKVGTKMKLWVAQHPSHSVSSLSFSPKADLLVATSWDNEVTCWEIKRSDLDEISLMSTSTALKASICHDLPVLCSTWKHDGTTVLSGGCDHQVKMWPLMYGDQPTTVAMHDAPIKDLAWIPEMNFLVTGSWDRTLQQAKTVHTQPLPDRCYTLSVRHPLMVVGTADKNLTAFNLKNPQVGSIEGRVGVQHLDNSQQNKNFTFKCHRDGNNLYSVNSINFHPVRFDDANRFCLILCSSPYCAQYVGFIACYWYSKAAIAPTVCKYSQCSEQNLDSQLSPPGTEGGENKLVYHTFSTTGSDGAINFWDEENKQ